MIIILQYSKGDKIMAVFQCIARSKVIGGGVQFMVILPEQCEKDVPVVYFLHGANATFYDTFKSTSIERYSTSRSLAIVLPTGANSYYSNMAIGPSYYKYISEELIPYTRRVFGLSDKREKTFIAGFSMGGYGATKFALTEPEKFGAVASMSGVMDIYERNHGRDSYIPKAAWGLDFEDHLKDSDQDLFELVRRLEASGKEKPWIYQCCGTEDDLLENNRIFNKFMEGRDFHYVYEESAGAHQWDYWDENIPKVLDFFRDYMKAHNVVEYIDKAKLPSSVIMKM